MNIPAGQFKATCLQVMEQMKRTRQPVTVTKRGKPLARIVPVDEVAPTPLFGLLKGTMNVRSDIVAPTGEVWNAER